MQQRSEQHEAYDEWRHLGHSNTPSLLRRCAPLEELKPADMFRFVVPA
jgi:hypothetical protein